jgi:hypothetical protein
MDEIRNEKIKYQGAPSSLKEVLGKSDGVIKTFRMNYSSRLRR